ncbi:MAG TPA: endonuclease/exonuclease/phosphatase family protein [bacterium]|nr:endonuclease/exonuclease/phosphatase family protein [bacterium]
MRAHHLPPVILLSLTLTACIGCRSLPAEGGSVVVMSYNLQTLFDPVDQGGEYAEFRVSSGAWDESRYRARLAALAASVLSASGRGRLGDGPDILVVEEAENQRVLQDLAAAAGGYEHVIASPDEEAVVACGVLSRYPVVAARAHRIRPPEGGPSSVPRYALEVELSVDGHRLVIIATHWKSKLGGAQETEPERQAAAVFIDALVASRLAADPALALVVAGDFNENPDEFERVERAWPTALMPAEAGAGPWLLITGSPARARDAARQLAAPKASPLVLFCPWDGAGGYSYRFEGDPERIDQLLLSPALVAEEGGALRFESFSAEPPQFAVDASGTPLAYNPRLNSGYSDHLPIRIRIAVIP